MNEMQNYLLAEFTDHYQAGQLDRRGFILRVVGICGGVTAAMGILSPLGLTEADVADAQIAPPPLVQAPSGITIEPTDSDIVAMDVEFPSTGGAMIQGYAAWPSAAGTYPAVVVIHENRGLNPHTRDLARRYAKEGFAAISVDLVSREGGTENNDPAQVPGILSGANILRHVDDAVAGGQYLMSLEGVSDEGFGITGFCFGGGIAWRAGVRERSILAAVPYYGIAPPSGEAVEAQASFLGMYGGNDARINASIPDLQAAFDLSGVNYQMVVYDGANHAFFNDTGANFHPDASADAWNRTVEHFRTYLPAAVVA
jgi:carboxymethylenebutenolidase